VYSIQHYAIKFVSDLWQVCGFVGGILVSSTNKTDCQDITEILLKVVLNTITPLNGYEGLLFQRCQLIEILISKL
jgi:hypothetical protein